MAAVPAKTSPASGAPSTTNAPAPAPIPGPVRAAVLLLALGEEKGAAIWQALSDDEARLVSSIMARLGPVRRETLLRVAADFMRQVSTDTLTGGPEPTEKILLGTLPRTQAKLLIEDIRTPESPDIWQKLSFIKPEKLAAFIAQEYPQVSAVILSRVSPEQAARVLGRAPAALATEIIDRMLRLEAVSDEVMQGIEAELEREFAEPSRPASRRDPMDRVAQIFNALEKKTESRFLAALDSTNRGAAQKLRALMFSFDDLARMDANSTQTLLRSIERDLLVKALKGASKSMREFFFAQMSQRAARGFQDDMDVMGPVKLKDVDEAQRAIVNFAKDLAAKGEIILATNASNDEMVA